MDKRSSSNLNHRRNEKLHVASLESYSWNKILKELFIWNILRHPTPNRPHAIFEVLWTVYVARDFHVSRRTSKDGTHFHHLLSKVGVLSMSAAGLCPQYLDQTWLLFTETIEFRVLGNCSYVRILDETTLADIKRKNYLNIYHLLDNIFALIFLRNPSFIFFD